MSETENDKPEKKVGEKLKEERLFRGIELADVARELKIPEAKIKALEEGELSNLSADVYARGFVRLYAKYLDLDPVALVGSYEKEKNENFGTPKEQKLVPRGLKTGRRALFVLTPRKITFFAIIIAVIAALAYLFFQVRGFTRAPRLILSSPPNNTRILENSVLVKGETDNSAEVTINGERTFVNESGWFEEKISIGQGLSTIIVKARGISGKESIVSREVLVEAPDIPVVVGASSSLQASPSPEGMSVPGGVTIKADQEAVWLSVLRDKEVVFSGLLAAGEEKNIDGGKKISITAGKGNKVLVKVGSAEWKVLSEEGGVVRGVEVGN